MARQVLRATKYPNLFLNEASGMYYIRIRNGGREVRKSLRTSDINKALVGLAAVLADAGSEALKIESLSWFALVELYVAQQKQRPGLKPKALESSLHFAEHAKKLVDRDVVTTSINRDACRAWWQRMAKSMAARTANGALGALRRCFAIAIEMGVIENDPSSGLERLKIRRVKLNVPSRNDFRRIIDDIRRTHAIYNRRMRDRKTICRAADAIEFLAYTGCRIGEAVQIRWSDIRDGLLYIPSNKHALEWRALPINPALEGLIERIKSQGNKGDYILQIATPTKALTNACIRLGIDHVRVHDLRHYFATTAIESGIDIPTVAKWLGHRDGGALAMRVYGHLRDEHSRASAKKLMF